MVDVRDCAQAHLLALKVPEAANKRFLCTNDSIWFKDLAKPVSDRFCPEGWPVTTALGEAPANDDGHIKVMDNTATKEVLGLQYRPYAETMVDMAAKMIEIGAVTKTQ